MNESSHSTVSAHPPAWRAYALAIVITIGALLLRLALTPWFGDRPLLILFVIPMVVTAYVGGLWPGLVSTALAAAVTAYFVLPPLHSVRIERPLDVAQWLFFVGCGALISVLTEELHRGHRARASGADVRRRAVFERNVQFACVLALASLSVVSVVSYVGMIRLHDDARSAQHARETIGQLDKLQANSADVQNGYRGRALTDRSEELAPYAAAAASQPLQLEALSQLIGNNSEQRSRLDALSGLLQEQLTFARRVIETRRAAGIEAARTLVMAADGKQLRAQIAAAIDEMKDAEGILLAGREQSAGRSAALTQAVIILGSLLAFVVVGLALFILRRDFAARRQAERNLNELNDQLEVRIGERTAELERVNEQLQMSERRFRAMIEHSGDAVILADRDGRVLYASPGVQNIEGYSPEELMGRLGSDNTHQDDLPVRKAALEGIMKAPGMPYPAQWRRRHRNGEWVWLEGVVTNLLDDPAVRAIVTNYRDITERKETEAKLQGQLARLALLARITRSIGERQDTKSIYQVVIRTLEEQMPLDFCCVCLYDLQHQALTVASIGTHSEALAMELALTEQSRVEIDENGLSRCVRGELVYEPDVRDVEFPFPQRLARGDLRALVFAPLQVESQIFGVLLAGRAQPASFTSTDCEFLRQASEHAALAAHQALLHGALQQAYDELRVTQQAVMQQERLRSLGQMASGIAHDINNAISPVALYTESLLEQEPNLSDRARRQLETIQRAIEDVAQTVSRMGELYRQREIQLIPLPVDLNRMVTQVLDLTRARWSDMAQQRGISLDARTELAPAIPTILGVESEIREALINLVFNALDAMQEGGVLTVKSMLRQGDNGLGAIQAVVVEVTDSGVGMDESTRRRCLEPFFTTKGERGTGLGLAMVYGAMQRHGADIEIDSEVGKGTTLRLVFPVGVTPVESAATTTSARAAPARLRILLVDDDPLLLHSLRESLESDGHVVTTANGGQAGIDTFLVANQKGEPFPVVITDLGMPVVDGRKVATSIKTANSQTSVLMLTGWGQRLTAANEIPANVDKVLNKPPKLKDLRDALARIRPRTGAVN